MLWKPTLLVWCLLFILKGVFYCQAAVDYKYIYCRGQSERMAVVHST